MKKTKRVNAIGRRTGISRRHGAPKWNGPPIDIMMLFELPELRTELKQHLKPEQIDYILDVIERYGNPGHRDYLICALQGRYLLFSPMLPKQI